MRFASAKRALLQTEYERNRVTLVHEALLTTMEGEVRWALQEGTLDIDPRDFFTTRKISRRAAKPPARGAETGGRGGASTEAGPTPPSAS